jgi:hypothetical protein
MSEQEPSALRECPFCNGAAGSGVSWHEHYGECGWVECGGCPGGMASDMGSTEAEAIERWNRRDGEAARVAEAVAAERARIVAQLRENLRRSLELLEQGQEYASEYVTAFSTAIAQAEDAP